MPPSSPRGMPHPAAKRLRLGGRVRRERQLGGNQHSADPAEADQSSQQTKMRTAYPKHDDGLKSSIQYKRRFLAVRYGELQPHKEGGLDDGSNDIRIRQGSAVPGAPAR